MSPLLTIRDAQLSLLSESRVADFIERWVRSLRTEHPDRFGAAERPARDLVERVIAWGRGNHVSTEAGIAVLLQLVVAFGESFELSPDREWALNLLAHPTLPPALKTGLLRERMMNRSQGRIVVRFEPGQAT